MSASRLAARASAPSPLVSPSLSARRRPRTAPATTTSCASCPPARRWPTPGRAGAEARRARNRAVSEKHPSPHPPSVGAMTISLSGVHVLADDLDAALSFYRDTLGLTVRNEVARDGFRWIILVTDSQPAIEIVLSQPHAGRSQEDGDALATLLANGELQMVQLRSDDLNATFDRVAAAPGAEVLQEPISQPRGARDIAVRDPAGNHVRIEQR